MAYKYRVTAKRDIPTWRTKDYNSVKKDESYIVECVNLNNSELIKEIEKVKGKLVSYSNGTISDLAWKVEKL